MTVSEAFSYKTHLLIATVLPQIRTFEPVVAVGNTFSAPPPLEMLGYGTGLVKTKVMRRLQAFSYGVIRPYHIAKVRSGGTRPRASSSSSSSSYSSSSAPLRTRGSWEWEALARVGEVVWILCVAHCFVEYVAEPYTVAGPSMEPTIRHMSVVAINKMRRRSAPLKVGEIVVAQAPPEPGRMVLKRVLGLAGDRIKVCPPPWDVNNTLDIEKRLEVVPEGHVWLEGDNKDNSTDSRSYGAVPQALVEGVVFVRLWPLRDAGPM